jgi:hypothetical protein
VIATASILDAIFRGDPERWFSHPLSTHGDEVWCRKCGRVEVWDAAWSSNSEHRRAIQRLIDDHRHPVPNPLTRAQRAKARVVGIRRTGALRCGYGSANG